MSKWIDADEVKIEYRGGFHDDYVINYNSFMNAPSIDIVRCYECKHNVGLTNGFWEEDIVCDYWESDGLTTNDYCSYGEREVAR